MTNNSLYGTNISMDEMDENELELIRKAASFFGRRGGRTRALIAGEMRRIGKISAQKRAISPETFSKMGKKGGAARAAAYTPEQRSEMARKAYAKRRAREEAAKQDTNTSPPPVGTKNTDKSE